MWSEINAHDRVEHARTHTRARTCVIDDRTFDSVMYILSDGAIFIEACPLLEDEFLLSVQCQLYSIVIVY